MLTASSTTAPFTFSLKAFSQGCTISLQDLVCTFIFILTVKISQCSQPYRQHTGRDPILRAQANVLSAGDVLPSGGEEGIVGSLNTVLLCGCIPKCFFLCVCVCARAMHHTELQQTTHTRGSTSAFAPISATEQTWHKVKGGVQEQGLQEVKI